VDDDSGIRECLEMLLISSGYEVCTAADGFTALLQLRGKLPAVIVSDLNMPEMSGYELLSIVRRRFPQVLSVAMSGAHRGDIVPSGVIADAFYAKGQNPTRLLSTVATLLRTSGARVTAHLNDSAPAWIPRNGNDSRGAPYVVVTCKECLRAFQLPVVEETAGTMLEVPCRFCPSENRYIIEPLGGEILALSA
jgi:CheY-like chemotaxis protein